MAVEAAVLTIHVAAGIAALAAGAAALGTTKGGPRHRRAGRGFVVAMAVVVGTVPPLLLVDPTETRVFLTLVAVFSGYLAFSGYRSLTARRARNDAAAADWAAILLVAGACLPLGGWGLTRVLAGEPLGVVMAVFGAIGLGFGLTDARAFRRGTTGEDRIVTHLTRMLAALIATVTAVSVVNLTMVPAVVAWLWPTALGTPLIAYSANRYGG